jgi:hypothetical protein
MPFVAPAAPWAAAGAAVRMRSKTAWDAIAYLVGISSVGRWRRR